MGEDHSIGLIRFTVGTESHDLSRVVEGQGCAGRGVTPGTITVGTGSHYLSRAAEGSHYLSRAAEGSHYLSRTVGV